MTTFLTAAATEERRQLRQERDSLARECDRLRAELDRRNELFRRWSQAQQRKAGAVRRHDYERAAELASLARSLTERMRAAVADRANDQGE